MKSCVQNTLKKKTLLINNNNNNMLRVLITLKQEDQQVRAKARVLKRKLLLYCIKDGQPFRILTFNKALLTYKLSTVLKYVRTVFLTLFWSDQKSTNNDDFLFILNI